VLAGWTGHVWTEAGVSGVAETVRMGGSYRDALIVPMRLMNNRLRLSPSHSWDYLFSFVARFTCYGIAQPLQSEIARFLRLPLSRFSSWSRCCQRLLL